MSQSSVKKIVSIILRIIIKTHKVAALSVHYISRYILLMKYINILMVFLFLSLTYGYFRCVSRPRLKLEQVSEQSSLAGTMDRTNLVHSNKKEHTI